MPKTYNAQHEVKKKMRTIGYDINDDGVCAGATMVAIEAAVNQDLNNHVEIINYIHSDAFKPRKHKHQHQLFPDIKKSNQKNIDAHATLDQIQLYHMPDMYYELFETSVSHHESDKISALAQSNKSIREGGLVTRQSWSWSGSYSDHALKMLLEEIKNAAGESQLIAMRLGGIGHHVALIYQNNEWTLVNIEKMPPKTFKSKTRLAEAIQEAVSDDNSDKTTLSFTVYSSGIERDNTQAFISRLKDNKKFKECHHISKRHIDDRDTIKLAQLVICNHQVDQLKKLIKLGLPVDTPTPSGYSLVYLAAQYGYPDMISELIKAGADCTRKEGPHDFTPLHVATEFQHVEAMEFLLEHGASKNINDETDARVKPIITAADHGNLACVKLLIRFGADFKSDSEYGTPLELAAEKSPETAEYIKQQLSDSAASKK